MGKTVDSTSLAREELIAGLRQLADWYEAHPDLPLADHLSVGVAVPGEGDEGVEQVRTVAAALGVEVGERQGHHWRAERGFGRVDFVVSHMDADAYNRWLAAWSYEGAVEPDGSQS